MAYVARKVPLERSNGTTHCSASARMPCVVHDSQVHRSHSFLVLENTTDATPHTSKAPPTTEATTKVVRSVGLGGRQARAVQYAQDRSEGSAHAERSTQAAHTDSSGNTATSGRGVMVGGGGNPLKGAHAEHTVLPCTARSALGPVSVDAPHSAVRKASKPDL